MQKARRLVPRNPNRRGRLSTVNLLALTSFGQFGFILKILINFVTKQATLMRRSTVLNLPPLLVFPACTVKDVVGIRDQT